MVTLIMSKFSSVGAERGLPKQMARGLFATTWTMRLAECPPDAGRRDTRAAASAARTGAVLARLYDRAGRADDAQSLPCAIRSDRGSGQDAIPDTSADVTEYMPDPKAKHPHTIAAETDVFAKPTHPSPSPVFQADFPNASANCRSEQQLTRRYVANAPHS